MPPVCNTGVATGLYETGEEVVVCVYVRMGSVMVVEAAALTAAVDSSCEYALVSLAAAILSVILQQLSTCYLSG